MKTYYIKNIVSYMEYIDRLIELEMNQRSFVFIGNNVGIICYN